MRTFPYLPHKREQREYAWYVILLPGAEVPILSEYVPDNAKVLGGSNNIQEAERLCYEAERDMELGYKRYGWHLFFVGLLVVATVVSYGAANG